MRVILTGGGTGGHIYPALAIAAGLAGRGAEILYVGTREGMEAGIVPAAGWEFRGISGRSLPRRLSPALLRAVGASCKALGESKRIFREFAPDLVVGTGGYVSGPVVLSAAFFGIPTAIHEQNALPGLTNRVLGRVARAVMLTFAASAAYYRRRNVHVTGLPVRPEIGLPTRAAGRAALGLDPARPVLLVTGGSRGALSLNKALLGLLPRLAERPRWQLIWATGRSLHEQIMAAIDAAGIDAARPGWRLTPYLDEMPAALAAADLCLTRAGAATLAELAATGRPAVLVPYPRAAGRHQDYNAGAFAAGGGALVIPDCELTADRLWESLEPLLADPARLAAMGEKAREIFPPGALERIVEILGKTAWT
ncbi:MAG: undecaprenyldiphospho-muramoylpentapeptide beta-N-acetylglucosaminyltransferase [Gracilibacteraceae bacterium]|jgi:UDP-N-acetylglucosamine--N-acetylmuramyl-(pentapeptide) pyrophosphoryl-undecaprenol N-acetylglucosamine transferase|nr:undecaprenyldiphospho-muramoylpentapeptide beta-N-acetylglucosaminyltransferase [Gracilibacteraceae bacterium]